MSLMNDARNILKKDPAASSLAAVVLLYPGYHALVYYKISHWMFRHRWFFFARLVSQLGRFFTGTEIHPGATIGERLFIDHGAAVVIGETAEVGNNVTIYHGVTLGGTGKDTGKRHPTVGDNVLIGAGTQVLGPITIGAGSRIGAGSTVLCDIPPCSTAVGSPAVVVRRVEPCIPSEDLNQRDFPNVLESSIAEMSDKINELEAKIFQLEEQLSAGETPVSSTPASPDQPG